jgi:phage gpG-like protein
MSLVIRNTLTAGFGRKLRALAHRRVVLHAMGEELVSLTRRAFTDPSVRPAPWPPRKSRPLARRAAHQKPPEPRALLIKSGALRDSIRVMAATNDTVSVGSDLPYAAVHQFGSARKKGRGGGIPARPFFPYAAAGNPTPLARAQLKTVAATHLRQLLGL